MRVGQLVRGGRLCSAVVACLLVLGGVCFAAQRAAADVIVAVVAPAAGQGADKGAAIRTAAEQAVAALNAAGGVAGETVRLVTDDDSCTGPGGTEAARRIAALQPALVLGHPCASAAVAAAKIYGPAKIVFVATATRHPALTQRRAGPTVFRLDGRDDRQGAFAAAILRRLYEADAVVLVSDRTTYARRIVTDARAGLVAAGGREPHVLTIVAGDKDYGRLVAEIGRSGAKAVLFAGFPLEAAMVLRQMRAAGIRADLIGTDATATREFVEAAGEAGRTARFIVPADPPLGTDGAEATVPAGAATAVAARTQAAIAAWAEAARRANAVAGQPLAAALQAGTGVVSFDAAGDAALPGFRLISPDDIAPRS